ncbi:VOC family protein [Sphingomonas bacterium]|uniref:VOC family protein n=1 Tax=Sphingomonas bacterium TaxID=1895847 RepID=UPI00260BEBF5|nr:VOC family protein [Sphingomonas bacterium]MDB5679899.1 Glyoxalase/bleomycin resistance protein/dioxygenase [Sphingomonas bacterium]
MALTGATVLLQVFDMNAAIAFYRDQLSFALVDSSPPVEATEGHYSHWCWLRRDAADLMLNTAYDADERPATRDAGRWTGHRDTCVYFGCDDTDALWVELSAKGIACARPHDTPYGMRQLYITDLDGYGLCFQHPVRR